MIVLPLLEVNPVAWTIVDAQFADTQPYRLYIPGIPKGKAIKSRRDQSTGPLILKP